MRIVEKLVGWSRRETGTTYKLLSLAAGSLFFLCVLPGLLTWIGLAVGFPPVSISPLATAFVIPLGLVPGAFLLGWATLTQWRLGRGTPAPTAPTQRLIIAGPYRLCRNPIELGAIFFYLGFGTLFGSLGAGIFGSLGALVLGSTYHRFVEERELLARFGDDYRRYRERTPFLIPSLSALLARHR